MNLLKIFVEDTAGNKYECDLNPSLLIGRIATDFFEAMGWSTENSKQRAVVELVIGKKRRNKRLRSEQTLESADVPNNATLRIFPEAIAGVDARVRRATLAADLRDIKILCKENDKIEYEAKPSSLPTNYTFEFHYESFSKQPIADAAPAISKKHIVIIDLPADYPLEAPRVRWETPIFHPNISKKDGAVCLGQLRERYLPRLGLGRIVSMLIEMLQWRNYDPYHSFNIDAVKWSQKPANWKYIKKIGGSPFQVPWIQIINPKHWGTSASKDSLYYGIEQPIELKIAWENYQKRKLIVFKSLDESDYT